MKKVWSAFIIWRTKTESVILVEKSAVCIAAEICLIKGLSGPWFIFIWDAWEYNARIHKRRDLFGLLVERPAYGIVVLA